MRIAYFDCHSGISGDMVLGALVDAGVAWDEIERRLRTLALSGWTAEVRQVRRAGFRASQVVIHAPEEHCHRHLRDIVQLIDASDLTPRQKELAKAIFRNLAEAEAFVHGATPDQVHFHEVGAVDSIVDIVGTAVGWDLLGAEQAVSSAVATGGGTVRIAHGQVSVPAPATAHLLQGFPLEGSDIRFELTTPTGAAILRTLVGRCGPLPAMELERIGCGAGSRDLPHRPNILRLFVGQVRSPAEKDLARSECAPSERVWIIEANVDDCTGEIVGYCFGRLLAAGALDVYLTPISMKKNRPGVMISVVCEEQNIPIVESVLFAETTTLGVRRYPVQRTVLSRRIHVLDSPWGPIKGKVTVGPAGSQRFSPEYEDCRIIAEKHGLPLRDVYEVALRTFQNS